MDSRARARAHGRTHSLRIAQPTLDAMNAVNRIVRDRCGSHSPTASHGAAQPPALANGASTPRMSFDDASSAQERIAMRDIVHTDKAPASPAYSQAVRAGGLVFVSGQGPFDLGGNVVGATIQEQVRQCLHNVSAVLQAAGSSLDKVAHATFILADEDDFAGLNEEWLRWFPAHPPARHGARLPVRPKGMKVSIAVVASA
jgi:2-iminobutanoate/2-iminopropanoate deaminase